jgi:hypothetical protein
MNKSVVLGALIIGTAILLSPFVFDYVKQAEQKEKQEKIAIQIEISDVTALDNAAEIYKEQTGNCPISVSDLIGVTINRVPKDRLGLDYKTEGDCKFKSFNGITSNDSPLS